MQQVTGFQDPPDLPNDLDIQDAPFFLSGIGAEGLFCYRSNDPVKCRLWGRANPDAQVLCCDLGEGLWSAGCEWREEIKFLGSTSR